MTTLTLSDGRLAQLREAKGRDLLAATKLTDDPSALSLALGAQVLKAIRKQMQRVGEAGRNFAEVSPRRQHRIRQQAKTARYAIDCLAPVLPHRLQGAVRRALVRFQDAAGRVQDSSVAAAAVQRLTRSAALHRELAAWAAQRRAKPAQKAQRLAARLSA